MIKFARKNSARIAIPTEEYTQQNMKIDLRNFEQQISPTILKRGLQYYKKGAVEISSQTSKEVVAHVAGSDEYTVTLHLNGETIEEAICTCPYDLGAACKHIAATLFDLNAEQLGIKVKEEKKTPSKPRKTKAEKESEEVAQILQNSTPEQLADFIEQLCNESREVRQLFLSKLRPRSATQSKSDYKSSLSAYAQALKKGGWINYSDAYKLGEAYYEVCNIANVRFEMEDYISAINAATAVIEQAYSAINYTDDSSGCIGGPIRVAIDLLLQIAAKDLNTKERLHLYKYCLKSYKKEAFAGWDWHDNMLELLVELVKEPKEIDEVKWLIESMIRIDKKNWKSDQGKRIKARFLLRTEGEEAAQKYKEQNLGVLDFRLEAIENYIAAKEYAEAHKLISSAIMGGIGYSDLWLDLLFRLESITGTPESIIEQACSTLISTIHQDIEPYYRKLKELVAESEWPEFLKNLYADIHKSSRYQDDKIRKIAIWEEDWDALLSLVAKSEHFGTLLDAESLLPPEYRPQIVEQYIRMIRYQMTLTHLLDRKVYQKITQAIRRMKKLGGIAQANDLTQELRAAHPRRLALQEELDLV